MASQNEVKSLRQVPGEGKIEIKAHFQSFSFLDNRGKLLPAFGREGTLQGSYQVVSEVRFNQGKRSHVFEPTQASLVFTRRGFETWYRVRVRSKNKEFVNRTQEMVADAYIL